MFLYSQSELFL